MQTRPSTLHVTSRGGYPINSTKHRVNQSWLWYDILGLSKYARVYLNFRCRWHCQLIHHRLGDQHNNGTANPFEPRKPRIAEYTAKEIATLSNRLEKQLGPEYISSRPGAGGGKVHYLAAEKCINLANDVFGFNGWSSAIQNIQIDFVSLQMEKLNSITKLNFSQVDESQSTGKVSLGLSVIVRVTLRDGTYHEVHPHNAIYNLANVDLNLGYWLWAYREL